MAEAMREGQMDRPSCRVVISANSFWNIANFRARLVEALAAAGHSILVAAPDADLDWAAERGVEARSVQIDRSGLNPIRDTKLIFDYWRLLSNWRAEYFLGFTAKPNIYGAFAARLTGAVSLPNISGLGTAFMSDGLLSRFVGWLYRAAFRRCPIIFFQNPDDRDLFVARKIVRPGQARLLPGSGIDLDHFKPEPALPGAAPRFLLIGRLLGDKGVREFVEAARMLKAGHPGWRFQLLGDVDPHNRTSIGSGELQGWLDQGIVEHLGHADDVRPHIAAATAVVLPSYREGMPRSLLEAAAMARPLIATDVPGNRQIVDHGVNGLLCEVRNARSLADAMERVGTMGEPERSSMGSAGRALVERDFSQDKVIAAYLDALAQLHAARGV